MARWFNSDKELPESLRDLTPEQIDAKLREASDLRTELDTVKADNATKAQSLTQLTDKVKELETKLAAPPESPPPPPPNNQDTPDYITDPEGAVRDQVTKTVAPVAALAFQAAALTAKQAAKDHLRRLPKDKSGISHTQVFDKYESEIDKLMEREKPEVRALPQSWVNAHIYVLGLHTGDLVAAARSNEDFFSEVPSGSPPPPPPADDKLSPEEQKIARKMKISEADYLKQRKAAQVVNV